MGSCPFLFLPPSWFHGQPTTLTNLILHFLHACTGVLELDWRKTYMNIHSHHFKQLLRLSRGSSKLPNNPTTIPNSVFSPTILGDNFTPSLYNSNIFYLLLLPPFNDVTFKCTEKTETIRRELPCAVPATFPLFSLLFSYPVLSYEPLPHPTPIIYAINSLLVCHPFLPVDSNFQGCRDFSLFIAISRAVPGM